MENIQKFFYLNKISEFKTFLNLHLMTFTLQETLFSAALAVYMTASVFVAAVRWGHRCKPYAQHMDYYYPAWRVVIFCFLSNLVMAPAIFMPADGDAVLQLRFLLILASPFFCAVLMFSYFGKVLHVGKWRKPVNTLAFPFCIMALTATTLVLIPGQQMDPFFCKFFFSAGGILALAFIACFVTALIMVARELRRFSEDNYSNPDDFPGKYASRILWLPIMHVLVSWTAAFIGTPAALSVGLIILSVFSLVLLIGILSPHRALDVKKLETGDIPADCKAESAHEDDATEEEEAEDSEPVIPQERQQEILSAIRQYVEQDKAYLDSHLTLNEMSRHIGINSKYVSLVLKNHLGGFFSYINRCRYAHVAKLKVEQPNTPIGELIDVSGFGSRSTYYTIRNRLKD